MESRVSRKIANTVQCCLLLMMVSVSSAATPLYHVAIESDDIVSRIIFEHLSEDLNAQFEYVLFSDFDQVLKAVEHAQVDFAANVTYTDARAKRFTFSAPINIEYTYLYSYDKHRLGHVSRVGIPEGTIYGNLIKESYPEIKQVFYSGTDQALQLLEDGHVDGVVDAINQLEPMLSNGIQATLLNDNLSIKPVSIIAPLGLHDRLLSEIEASAQSSKLQRQLRNEVKQYQFKLQQDALRRDLTESRLDVSTPLLVKLESLVPFNLYSSDGSIEGITANVLFQACEILQIECVVTSDADETWESMYTDFVDKKIDILGPLTVSSERQQIAHFTRPHYFPEAVMIKRRGYKLDAYHHVSELIVERIGVVKDDFFADLLSYMLPQKKLKYFEDSGDLLTALIDGEVDYIPLDRANYNYLILSDASLPIEKDEEIGPFFRSKISLGFSKTLKNELLVPYFDRAIAMVDTQSIIEDYDKQPNWRAIHDIQHASSRQLSVFLSVLVVSMLLVAFYFNHLAKTDYLTGLNNRRALMRRFVKDVPSNSKLIYIDVDHFKPINDTYGHAVGDEVLKLIAKTIRRECRCFAYRIGGDEFILITRGDTENIDHIKQALQSIDLQHEGQVIPVHLSVGVVETGTMPRSLSTLMHEADVLMYQMKAQAKQSMT